MAQKIKLVICNEAFWGKGLIYSQNILPLLKLRQEEEEDVELELISFTPLHQVIKYKTDILNFRQELESKCFRVKIRPILFLPSRSMKLYWLNLVLLIFSAIPYLFFQSLSDLLQKEKSFYHLRSYFSAFIYKYLYKGNAKLIFDPRSDYINENLNIGTFKPNSIYYKFWFKQEKKMLYQCSKTVFISDEMRMSLLQRHRISIDTTKYIVINNMIDYTNFAVARNYQRSKNKINFLYTGSLGHWNNISNYFNFFIGIKKFIPESNFIIITNSPEEFYKNQIDDVKYRSIRKSIKVLKKVAYDELQNYYKTCHIGLQLLEFVDSRIGVKFIEYVAAGLVPIINTNVEGATQFCKHNIGIVINSDSTPDYEHISKQIFQILEKDRSEGLNRLKERFDVNEAYQNIKKLYK